MDQIRDYLIIVALLQGIEMHMISGVEKVFFQSNMYVFQIKYRSLLLVTMAFFIAFNYVWFLRH